ncbi:uncharacterized protein LOC133722833 [Rosa rugosa]|uniref:uncharacterized protein LOC133722833 n=1 Tax=Rosa rugosa TaxID=74645 RepID=UPI002B40C7B2|nr:uncharacterized protein LOC133722833 [Rosa rugosa]
MGCVSSNLFNHDDDFSQLGSSALSPHIVSLTSSTYGLLTLDPPPPPPPTPTPTPTSPPSRFTLGSIFPTSLSEPRLLWSNPKSSTLGSSWPASTPTDFSFHCSHRRSPSRFELQKPHTTCPDEVALRTVGGERRRWAEQPSPSLSKNEEEEEKKIRERRS